MECTNQSIPSVDNRFRVEVKVNKLSTTVNEMPTRSFLSRLFRADVSSTDPTYMGRKDHIIVTLRRHKCLFTFSTQYQFLNVICNNSFNNNKMFSSTLALLVIFYLWWQGIQIKKHTHFFLKNKLLISEAGTIAVGVSRQLLTYRRLKAREAR